MAKKFSAPAPTFIPARWHGGDQTPRTIVIHGTVSPCANGGARAVAKFFAQHSQPTSAHYTVDPSEIIQSVGDHTVAYHCGYNQDSIGVELCDPQVGKDSRWQDANHAAMLKRAATLVAQLCLAYDIPVKRISVADLKAGRHGICGHADMSQAFKRSTHTDPGAGFPWTSFMLAVSAEAARLSATPAAKPKPVKRAKAKKVVKVVGDLTIGHGNMFKDNAHKAADVAMLDKQTAHVFGLNEAFRFQALLKTLKNYRVVSPGSGAALNNVVLLRHDVTYLGEGTRKMCDKVGSSPERTATWALYEHAGEKWAHIQTHTNAHIEDGGKPRNLPRVTQDIRHLANLSALVRELRAQGYRVTVAGDFNWAYRVGKVWANAPRVVFWRLGMYVNWQHRTAPAGGSLGSRRIDYLAHDDADLRIAGQRIVTGEHSDHRWLEVTYRVVAG